jgi:RecB family exonuclease
VEATARCPWQTFLRRVLRLEAPPDPLEALPGLDPSLLGTVVHAVLERIARDAVGAGPADLREARAREPVPVRWPARERVESILVECAAQALREEGVPLPGLERVLAARARPLVERARALDWPDPGSTVPVLAAELEGAVELRDAAGRARPVRFRADRVDAAGAGLLRLTDYKTGRPIHGGVQAGTREQHFLRRVESGLDLQAAAYALAGGEGGDRGRFLFLREDVRAGAAEFAVRGDDAAFAAAFRAAAGIALRAWDAGAFFPRLVGRDLSREARQCSRCEVAEACVRGDSGARRRLIAWMEARPAPQELAPAERALLAAWELGGDA